MTARLLKFKQDNFQEFLDELSSAHKVGKLKTIACIAQVELEEKNNDFAYSLPGYWFGGDSCTEVLGLLEIMKDRILEYMRCKNED